MRTNLIRMLDGIGVHTALDLASCADLFDSRTDLATSTSSVCHAVFVRDGRNYSGAPPVGRHPVFDAFARQVLAANLAMASRRSSSRWATPLPKLSASPTSTRTASCTTSRTPRAATDTGHANTLKRETVSPIK
jgi:hypothetical protein